MKLTDGHSFYNTDRFGDGSGSQRTDGYGFGAGYGMGALIKPNSGIDICHKDKYDSGSSCGCGCSDTSGSGAD